MTQPTFGKPTPQPESNLDAPRTLTTGAEGDIAAPRTLAAEAEGVPAVPGASTEINPIAQGTVAAPRALSAEAPAAIQPPEPCTGPE